MTCKQIIKEYLEKNGYDGLTGCEWDDCGCEIIHLIPCEHDFGNCEPAYKHPCPGEECKFGGCDFHMSTKKPKTPFKEQP